MRNTLSLFLAVLVLAAIVVSPASAEGTPTPVCQRVLVNGRPQEACSEAPQEVPTETQTVVVVTRTTTATATPTATVTQPLVTATATTSLAATTVPATTTVSVTAMVTQSSPAATPTPTTSVTVVQEESTNLAGTKTLVLALKVEVGEDGRGRFVVSCPPTNEYVCLTAFQEWLGSTTGFSFGPLILGYFGGLTGLVVVGLFYLLIKRVISR